MAHLSTFRVLALYDFSATIEVSQKSSDDPDPFGVIDELVGEILEHDLFERASDRSVTNVGQLIQAMEILIVIGKHGEPGSDLVGALAVLRTVCEGFLFRIRKRCSDETGVYARMGRYIAEQIRAILLARKTLVD